MAVDDRYKRASAIAPVSPFIFTAHTDTTSGVDAAERMSATWMYSGIAAGEPAASVWTNIMLDGIVLETGEHIHIVGRYKER